MVGRFGLSPPLWQREWQPLHGRSMRMPWLSIQSGHWRLLGSSCTSSHLRIPSSSSLHHLWSPSVWPQLHPDQLSCSQKAWVLIALYVWQCYKYLCMLPLHLPRHIGTSGHKYSHTDTHTHATANRKWCGHADWDNCRRSVCSDSKRTFATTEISSLQFDTKRW